MNTLLALALKGGTILEVGSKVMSAAEWAVDKFKTVTERKEVKVDDPMTEDQAALVDSPDVSFDLRETIVKLLPEKILDNVNDGSKSTVATCKLVLKALDEVKKVVEKVMESAQKVDEAIED